LDLSAYSWEDARGWGLNLLKASLGTDPTIGDLHVVSMEPGSVRGNHFHDAGVEWLLILNGPVDVIWSKPSGTSQKERIIEFPALYRIPPGVAHAVINVSAGVVFLVAVGDQGERETRPCTLVEGVQTISQG